MRLHNQEALDYPTGPSAGIGGSQANQEGRYQFQSPSSFIVAGSNTARTIVASIIILGSNESPITSAQPRERRPLVDVHRAYLPEAQPLVHRLPHR